VNILHHLGPCKWLWTANLRSCDKYYAFAAGLSFCWVHTQQAVCWAPYLAPYTCSNWYVDLQIILDVLLSGGVPTRNPSTSGMACRIVYWLGIVLADSPLNHKHTHMHARKQAKTHTHTRTHNTTDPQPASVDLYFSNPDLLWANDFPRNRLGQVGHSLWGCAAAVESLL